MAAPMTRSQFQRGLFPGIRELIFRGFKEFPEEYTQLFNIYTSDSAFEEDNQLAGVGLFVRTPELVEAAEDSFLVGFPKRYQHEDYSLKIGASKQLRRDDKTGYWRDRGPDLGFSARQTKEILHADMFNTGFAGGMVGPDGQQLFSTTHPNVRQGTQSNILNPVSTINVLAVRLALTTFRRFFDDTGIRRRMLMAKWLVHPPEEEYNVLEILKSAGRPDTANRADNVVRNALTPFTYDYLTDTNNWFVLSDKNQHKLKSFNREAFDVREYMSDDPQTNWVVAEMAFSFGWSHWIGTLGSNPV